MKKKIYKPYIIMMLIFSVTAVFLSYYSMGVIDRWESRSTASMRLEQICATVDESISHSTQITEEIYENYKSKSRIVAIILSKNTETMKNDVSFEELRVAIGASVINVSDNQGIIEYSTNLSKTKQKVNDEFLPAIQNKVFSEAVLNKGSKETKVITGSSRLDSDGVIQIEYNSGNAEMLLEMNDLSNLLTDIPFMENGHLALIDAAAFKYISHTDSKLNGTAVQYQKSKFENESGWFESEFEGEDVMVQYLKHNEYIVICMRPFSDIYSRRNSVTAWLIAVLSACTFVTLLVVRNKILIYNSHISEKP
ncbi:MAG: hypothetical protein ACI4I9_03785 [Porcipelethomonas sp.]